MTQIPSSSYELPDREIRELQQRINGEAKAGHVNFFAAKSADGGLAWSVIFCDGPRRATVRLQNRPTEADIDSISTALASWATYHAEGSAYTTEVPSAPSTEWS
jgi:hypothetical protein